VSIAAAIKAAMVILFMVDAQITAVSKSFKPFVLRDSVEL
jgi:hypothetical protein